MTAHCPTCTCEGGNRLHVASPHHGEVVITESERVPWPWRVAWGLVWRYLLFAALMVYAESRVGVPYLPLCLFVVGGFALGLYRRRWVLARVWRTLMVAAVAVWLAPLTALYGTILIGSLGGLTVAPVVATWRRRG